MSSTEDLDYVVLEYIAKHGPVTIETVAQALPDIVSVNLRMKAMQYHEPGAEGYILQKSIPYQDGSLTRMIPSDDFVITELGERALQDYRHATRKHQKELWLKNAWIPIIVSFVTTLATNYILPKLPLLIEWFHHILQRIL